jgi:antitoxin component YwqK of YwqJK toxin-antitoxin module
VKKLLILLFSILISFNSYGETKYSYYENGQMEYEENYKDDKLDGKLTSWYASGQIERGKIQRWQERGQGDLVA